MLKFICIKSFFQSCHFFMFHVNTSIPKKIGHLFIQRPCNWHDGTPTITCSVNVGLFSRKPLIFHIHSTIHLSIDTCIHTYIHAYLHTFLPTHLPTYLATYLPTHPSTHPLTTCLPTYLPAYLTYLPTHLHTCIQADRQADSVENRRAYKRKTILISIYQDLLRLRFFFLL